LSVIAGNGRNSFFESIFDGTRAETGDKKARKSIKSSVRAGKSDVNVPFVETEFFAAERRGDIDENESFGGFFVDEAGDGSDVGEDGGGGVNLRLGKKGK
jgi:hypothetical protein